MSLKSEEKFVKDLLLRSQVRLAHGANPASVKKFIQDQTQNISPDVLQQAVEGSTSLEQEAKNTGNRMIDNANNEVGATRLGTTGIKLGGPQAEILGTQVGGDLGDADSRRDEIVDHWVQHNTTNQAIDRKEEEDLVEDNQAAAENRNESTAPSPFAIPTPKPKGVE